MNGLLNNVNKLDNWDPGASLSFVLLFLNHTVNIWSKILMLYAMQFYMIVLEHCINSYSATKILEKLSS